MARRQRQLRTAGLRRPSGWWLRQGLRGKQAWAKLRAAWGVWLALFLLAGAWSLLPAGTFSTTEHVSAGGIAHRDYEASRALLVPDLETTQAKQQAAREAVLPVFDFDPGLASEREQQVDRLFAEGRKLTAGSGGKAHKRPTAGDLAAALSQASGLQVSPQEAELLAKKGFPPYLDDRIRGLLDEVLTRGIVANKSLLLENRVRGITLRTVGGGERTEINLFDFLAYPSEVEELLRARLHDLLGFSSREREALVGFMIDNLSPNLVPNRAETRSRRQAAVAGTPPVFTQIHKGQMIVRKGDQITASQARAIAELAGERRTGERLVLPILGVFVLLSLVALVLALGARAVPNIQGRSGNQLLGELLLLSLLALLGARFGLFVATALAGSFDSAPFNSVTSYLFALPFASLALVVTLLYRRGIALITALLFAVVMGWAVAAGALWPVVYALAGSLAGIYALERFQFKQRSTMIRAGLVIALTNAVTILMLVALQRPQAPHVSQVGFDVVCGLIGGLLAAAAASFAVPLFESVFSLTTDIRLIELANTNLPLLRRLAFAAPGTFQHSLMVANLAKEGCEAVGADPVLAYTGALYHDIGKIFRPEYFVENQRNENRHDHLAPSMSALILINHVKEGLDLAEQYHLPQPIHDAIAQHHGTRLITYFFNRALERADPDNGEVSEEEYRYPGPKPQTKVMGILMLADGVEAASRSLAEASPARLRSVVRAIVDDCLKDGQLDQTDLTLSDLNRVGEAFLRVLANFFHRRIDYPGFNFNEGEREKISSQVVEVAKMS